jgi:serine protease AprX
MVGVCVWIVNASYLKSNQLESTQSYIVSSKNFKLLQSTLRQMQITPTHQLPIIDAVATPLTEQQRNELEQTLDVTITENHQVEMAGGNAWGKRKWQPVATTPDYIDADYAHAEYNFGDAVTIGFLDTGLDQLQGTSNGLGLSTDLYGRDKFWGTYDAINNTLSNYSDEENGHGTHVASIAANSDYDVYGRVYGVAPNAAVVGIKAFDYEGKATYADVIRGINWAVEVKDAINLRVLNMSFSGPVRSYYWQDPLNQAVMKAWQAGIVIVASAGNKGPDPMTIGVPGNVPYIITVGAMTDNYTSTYFSDDKLASFSAAGPTPSGFVKPDVLAPGGHLAGLMAYDTQIASDHPEFHDGGLYFQMSGTSQAAAVVSGAVALMLTDNPSLSPDDVKCRLMDSARPATTSNDMLAYSVFQQGAGVVNVNGAINSTASGCANQALDIAKDLNDEAHYFGPANINEDGNFYVEGLGEDYVWDLNNGNVDGSALIWKVNHNKNLTDWSNMASTDALIWKVSFETDALIWKVNLESDALIWKVNLETDALIWKVNFDKDGVNYIGINSWVDQE